MQLRLHLRGLVAVRKSDGVFQERTVLHAFVAMCACSLCAVCVHPFFDRLGAWGLDLVAAVFWLEE